MRLNNAASAVVLQVEPAVVAAGGGVCVLRQLEFEPVFAYDERVGDLLQMREVHDAVAPEGGGQDLVDVALAQVLHRDAPVAQAGHGLLAALHEVHRHFVHGACNSRSCSVRIGVLGGSGRAAPPSPWSAAG